MDGIIRRFLASLGDPEQMKALVDPVAEFIGVRAERYPEVPTYGRFVGYEGLAEFVAGVQTLFDPQLFEIEAELESDEIGFATGRMEERAKATGAHFRTRWTVFCRFKDGRIVHYRFFEDTAALEEAVGVRTASRETVA